MDEDVARWTSEIAECDDCLCKDAETIIRSASKYVETWFNAMARTELFIHADVVAGFPDDRFLSLRYALDSAELDEPVDQRLSCPSLWPHLRADLDSLDRVGYSEAIGKFETQFDIELRLMFAPIGHALAEAGITNPRRWAGGDKGFRYNGPMFPMDSLRAALDLYQQTFCSRFRLIGELRAAQSRANRRIVEERLSA